MTTGAAPTGPRRPATPAATPRPLRDWPLAEAARVHTVFADIDDTISTEGRITSIAYDALERLRDAGLRIVPVTGRPAGWCDHIARMWPVDAVVGENGAFWMWRDETAGKLRTRHRLDEATRAESAARLREVAARVLREVPGSALASDQFCRLYDIAIDFREDVPPLPVDAIERIVATMHAAGMHAKVSSIHVNGWFGDWDKLETARLMMRERFGIDVDGVAERARCVFVGDSPNDAPMFAFFPNAVGVANVADFAGRIEAMPAWITPSRAGAGFAELAQRLLEARTAFPREIDR
ncbi:MAG: HAD-IIB family hydrolase [Burkholderiaceae bacterium]|nr:HAD-IIB family hydrolase [Burkholderiaceae bacterium]